MLTCTAEVSLHAVLVQAQLPACLPACLPASWQLLFGHDLPACHLSLSDCQCRLSPLLLLAGPHNNLVSNVNLGRGTRAFHSGGNEDRGTYAGGLGWVVVYLAVPALLSCNCSMPAGLLFQHGHTQANMLSCRPCLIPAPHRPPRAAANNTWWNVLPADKDKQVALPPCDFGPLLAFVGNYGEPERPRKLKGEGDRRLLEAGDAAAGAQAEGTAAAAGGAQAAAAAFDLFPDWCKSSQWWVENVQPGKRLYPSDIHAAMVSTRKSRLGV